MDNNSTDEETIKYLNQLKGIMVLKNENNTGPWVNYCVNQQLFYSLPDKFILTDPDLELNPRMPRNFERIMGQLSDELHCDKVGLAIEITDHDLMFQEKKYDKNLTIYEWESQFWKQKINHPQYELYKASIDTTFCLINKKNFFMRNDNCVRMGGDFTCRHLPYYIDDPIMTWYDRYLYSLNCPHSSTNHFHKSYIEEHFLIINKNNIPILIKNDPQDPNLTFWTNVFSKCDNDQFRYYDMYLKKDKTFIDIGGWIGSSCMYAAKKCKHSYIVEADPLALVNLRKNCELNCHNVTIIDRAIYHMDDTDVIFGKNEFITGGRLNDSACRIANDQSLAPIDGYSRVKTITLQNIIDRYAIDMSQVSLIKVDIEGGEEDIMNDLFECKQKYHVPLYISFHVPWWKDKNIERFRFLENYSHLIHKDNFISIIM
jgi:FkbM family methyltransferase